MHERFNARASALTIRRGGGGDGEGAIWLSESKRHNLYTEMVIAQCQNNTFDSLGKNRAIHSVALLSHSEVIYLHV